MILGTPNQAEQLHAAEEAKLANPLTVPEREASATKFEGMNAGQAAKLAEQTFPGLIDKPAGGPLRLDEGQRIVGYPSDNAAQIELSNGEHGVIESLAPIAVETSPGHRMPVDLGLSTDGSAYQPVNPVVPVRIPNQLADGVAVSDLGLSLTPVDPRGGEIDGAPGTIDGAGVIYPNTQPDTDTVVKPLTEGFEVDTLLRSRDSPQELSYRVGLPAGAHLDQPDPKSGLVRVLDGDVTLAMIGAPNAHDSEGTAVPMSIGVSGDLLKLTVQHDSGMYAYPIDVDPWVYDKTLGGTASSRPTNWRFAHSSKVAWTGPSGETLTDYTVGGYTGNEYGVFQYPIQPGSDAQVDYVELEVSGSNTGGHLENKLQIVAPSGEVEEEGYVGTNPERGLARAFIGRGTGAPGNAALLGQFTTGSGEAFSYTIYSSRVEIYQPATHDEVNFDRADSTIDGGRENVLYGSGGWLGPNSGALEVTAHDPGIGISYLITEDYPAWTLAERYLEEGKCQGVQCNESPRQAITYHSNMPDGEEKLKANADNAMESGRVGGENGESTALVKVDGSAPHDLSLTGLPSGNEISEQPYQVKASASDGSGGVPSSGIKSIEVTADGQKVAVSPTGVCSPGPCGSAVEWTMNGETLGAGKNTVAVTATDNAGNVESKSFEVTVRHATPVPAGPGQLNPISGQLDLSATDVSLAAPPGALSVSRTYASRQLTAGAAGPLGPQWTMSAGSQERLERLADGSVNLNGIGSGLTHFKSDGKGGYEAPSGDASLTLTEVKEGEQTKEFLLKNASRSTTTRFTLPSGASGAGPWMPTVAEGPVATDTVTGSYQTAEVEGQRIIEPVEELGPVPSGVSCSPKLEVGCRALTFAYAGATTSGGEAEGEWGDFKGRLSKVSFTAYSTSSKEMVTTAVAQYQYDQQGRLRAEWDPRISPALKATYGYDGEGHVTALSTAGHQPWLLDYGTISSDSSPGRLLSVTRPPASTALGNGQAPQSSALPTLSSTKPAVGTTLKFLSNGTWSNAPLAYSYQWEDCNSTGEACAPILAAVNGSYTPQARDAGHTLVLAVTATNATGSTVASTAPSAVVPTSAPAYVGQFGGPGEAEGKLSSLTYDAVDANGSVWVTDYNSGRIVEFNSEGKNPKAYGKEGSGNGEFKHPLGIAINQTTGHVYVNDLGNHRIEELNGAGEFVQSFGQEAKLGNNVQGVAVDPSGNVWVADSSNYRVVELSPTGQFLKAIGSHGKGEGQFEYPTSVAFLGSNAYVTDQINNRVIEFSSTGAVVRTFGSKGAGKGQFSAPTDITAEPVSETLYVVDSENARIEQFSASGQYLSTFGSRGTNPGQFQRVQGCAVNAAGDVYAPEEVKDKVEEFAPTYSTNNPVPAPPEVGSNAVTTIDYRVPVSGSAAPYALGAKDVEAWAQKDDPVEATAIFPADEPMGWPAKDYKRANVLYLDAGGRAVNTAAPGGAITTSEYNETNEVVRTLGADNRAAALHEGSKSAEASQLLDSQSTYNAEGSELLSTLGPQHTVKLSSGAQVQARAHEQYSYDEGAPSEGGPYRMATKVTESALTSGKDEDTRTTTTSYSGQENLGWKLRQPTAATTDPAGLKLSHTAVYEASSGAVKEAIAPAGNPNGGDAHDSQTIYYTTSANPTYPGCGKHPEWASLPCQTQPAKQPGGSLPKLPVTTATYNTWDEPEATTATVGSSTRTTSITYDSAGRTVTSALSSSVGTALPTVTYKYDSKTGALSTQSTTVEGKTKTVTSVFNTLAQLVSYTDADENTSTFSYDVNGRPQEVADGKGSQAYSYDPTTGFLIKLVDSAAGTFTAGYDTEGKLQSEGYPNGMSASYSYNQVGQATGLEYVKTTHCSSKCTWFADAVSPSIHGQWLSQTSSLSSQSYSYDNAGRLQEVKDTPTEQGCTVMLYANDADTNRTSMTSREPGSGGKCATTGGTVEKHTYDEADRLVDAGAKYDEFGNVTSLPASDAGGAELTSSYYANDGLASQTQSGETIGYNLDPTGRTREIVATGKSNADTVDHYSSSGGAPAWTEETPSGHWTRNIPGIDGSLAAVQSSGQAPILQLTNLHGDIVATAALSETETKLLTTNDTTEYGVPRTSTPPRYSWLGADARSTELSSGIVAMGARSYVPQLGRFLQVDPQPGGSADAYTYTFGDPVNASDPSGEWTFEAQWLTEFDEEWAAGGEEREAAFLAAQREADEREAARIAQIAAEYAATEARVEAGRAAWSAQMAEEEALSNAWTEEVLQRLYGGGGSGRGSGGAWSGQMYPVGNRPGYDPGVHGERPGGGDVCRSGGKMVHGRCQEGPKEGHAGNTCRTVAGSTAPLAISQGAPGITLWIIGVGVCYVKD